MTYKSLFEHLKATPWYADNTSFKALEVNNHKYLLFPETGTGLLCYSLKTFTYLNPEQILNLHPQPKPSYNENDNNKDNDNPIKEEYYLQPATEALTVNNILHTIYNFNFPQKGEHTYLNKAGLKVIPLFNPKGDIINYVEYWKDGYREHTGNNGTFTKLNHIQSPLTISSYPGIIDNLTDTIIIPYPTVLTLSAININQLKNREVTFHHQATETQTHLSLKLWCYLMNHINDTFHLESERLDNQYNTLTLQTYFNLPSGALNLNIDSIETIRNIPTIDKRTKVLFSNNNTHIYQLHDEAAGTYMRYLTERSMKYMYNEYKQVVYSE